MKKTTWVFWGLIVILAGVLSANRPLTFEERVEAQKAIERVYYNHRIWPKENPGPKPPFEEMVPEAVIRQKVEDGLLKSAALEHYWGRPLTGAQLQAEMDRTARETRAPEVLKELFAALKNDPLLIAECLARPNLADRTLRAWFSQDERFQGDQKREAMALLRQLQDGSAFSNDHELYTPIHLLVDDPTRRETDLSSGIQSLSQSEFEALAAAYPAEGLVSAVEETPEAFLIRTTTMRSSDELIGGVYKIDKASFDAFFQQQIKGRLSPSSQAADHPYALPSIGASSPRATEAETPDAWTPLWFLPEGRKLHSAVWTGSEMIVWGGNNGPASYLNTGGRYNPATDNWVPTTIVGAPAGRAAHTAVWAGTEMIVWGGSYMEGPPYYTFHYLNTGGRYNPVMDSWTATEMDTSTPTARYAHTAVWTGVEMLVWGGTFAADMYTNTGAGYNPFTRKWRTMSGTGAPTARAYHTAVWVGTQMIIWGGYGCASETCDTLDYLNTGARYSPSVDKAGGAAWTATSIPTGLLDGRERHTAVSTGSEMIVWGGYRDDGIGQYYYNDGARYFPSTNSWMLLSLPSAPAGRCDHTAVWTGAEMIVWGGTYRAPDPHYENSGGRYVLATNIWKDLDPDATATPPAGRYNHTAVWAGTEMIVWGGWNDTSYFNSGGRYDPALADDGVGSTLAWIPTQMPNAPSPRYRQTAVWTGAEMIVWGGYAGTAVTNTGGIYDPSTHAWRPTCSDTGTPCNAPSARQDHTAVWTGTRMIIWGGGGNFGTPTNTGGLYSPEEGTWIPTCADPDAPCNAPSARFNHTAVWTGTEMIVWGGVGLGSIFLNTGGHFDFATNTWSATSTENAPLARGLHTAVWTGTEMIVWGGRASGGTYFNNGGRYRGYMWSPTKVATAPPARAYHKAVWTGTEMIVWGGYNGTMSLNTGGRYDPSRDKEYDEPWHSTLADETAPGARRYHSAAWSGAHMIVWGGEHLAQGAYNSGGLYDPLKNTWKSTCDSAGDPCFCPSPRKEHSAVWTPDGMIIWDGYPMTQAGGIYHPNSPPRSVPIFYQEAVYSNTLHAPVCASKGSACDTGDLVRSRGMLPWYSDPVTMEPEEPNYPNTIHREVGTQCDDGFQGNWASDESIEHIRVYSVNQRQFTYGNDVVIEVTVYADDVEYTDDRLDLFYTTDPGATSVWWTHFATLTPYRAGLNVLRTTHNLVYTEGTAYAIRAQFRRGGDPTEPPYIPDACIAGDYNDRDDLVFTLSGESSAYVPPVAYILNTEATLTLDGASSTDGSIPYTAGLTREPYHDPLDAIVSYEWDLNGDAFAGTTTCNSAPGEGFDRVGSRVLLTQSDLEGIGIASPGLYRALLRVSDRDPASTGVKERACTEIEYQVMDGDAPAVTVLVPNGAESWPYSPEPTMEDPQAPRNEYYLLWNAHDFYGVRRTRLSFTTDSATTPVFWSCIADSGVGYYSQGPQQQIPEGAFVAWPIEVFENNYVKITVTVNIAHPNVGDLDLVLVDPDGVEYLLSSSNGGDGDNYQNTIFDSQATNSITGGTPPFSGLYSPEASLPTGGSVFGTWKLKVSDTMANGAKGFLVSWSIHFATMDTMDCPHLNLNNSTSPTDILLPTSGSFLWQAPRVNEVAGQLLPSSKCRLKVEVWDTSGNQGTDVSDANFYLTTPTSTAVRTVILWNSGRIAARYPGQASALNAKLKELAAHQKVDGVILDLHSADPQNPIRAAYDAWDLNSVNPAAANAVAAAIRTYLYDPINGKISKKYTNTEYIILVGDDQQIPFYRMLDGTMVEAGYSESQYPLEVPVDITSPVGAALREGYFLSDNYYSESRPEASGLAGTEGEPHYYVYQNDYAIGRLVETPTQIAEVIETFLARGGEQALHPDDKSLVTGFTFVYDSAMDIKAGQHAARGSTSVDCLMDDPSRAVDDTDCSHDGPAAYTDFAYTPADLMTQLLEKPHWVSTVMTHANHYAFAASTGQTTAQDADLCTDPAYGPVHCHAQGMDASAYNLRGGVLVTSGCHSGLSIPNTGVRIPDLEQADSEIWVGDSGIANITKITVRVNIGHTNVGDLALYLVGPDGAGGEQIVFLSYRNGGDGDHYTDTVFDMDADTPIALASPPFTGSFVPDGDLSVFNGLPADGIWALRALDLEGNGVAGAILDWSITFYPSPATSIPDGGQVASTIEVADTGLVNLSDVNVRVDIQHDFVGALKIYLIGPDGAGGKQEIALSLNNGGAGANYTDTVFDDQAGTWIKDGTPPFTGSFRPEDDMSGMNLAAFNGRDADGPWTLRVVETAGEGSGALLSWSITFNDSATFHSSFTARAPMSLDLPEQMAKKKAVAYVGNTGYGWAIEYGRGLTELLMEHLSDELFGGSSATVGQALAKAKRTYFLEEKRYDVFDEKVMHQMTLFGIPNYLLVMADTRTAREEETLPPPDGPDYGCANGICLEKSFNGGGPLRDVPDGITELQLNFTFSDSTYKKVEVKNTSGTKIGEYYTLNGVASGETGDAVQPKFIYDSHLSGTKHHGVIFTGGTYTTLPLVPGPAKANPKSTPSDPNSGSGPLPSGHAFVPALRSSLDSGGSLSLRGSEEKQYLNMVVHTALCADAVTCASIKRFGKMQFVVYYHADSSDYTKPEVLPPGGSFHTLDGLTTRFQVSAMDMDSGLYRVLVTYDDRAGKWRSLDLAYNELTGYWEGDLALTGDITYFIQAIDNAGNLGHLTVSGYDQNLGGQKYGSEWEYSQVFDITLEDDDLGVGDGIPDAWERLYECVDEEVDDAGEENYTCEFPVPATPPLVDPDMDCLSNLAEFKLGTNPCVADTDGGGESDGSETRANGTFPTRNPSANRNDDKDLTIDALRRDGDDIIIDWPDGSPASGDCSGAPNRGSNDRMDGYYWVYRGTDPAVMSPNQLVTSTPVADGIQCYRDAGAAAAGEPNYYYLVWNAPIANGPTILGLVPDEGPINTQTAVTIVGDHFRTGAAVTFCDPGEPATDVVVDASRKLIACKTPAHLAAEFCPVKVTNPDGQYYVKANAFEFTMP